MLKEYLKIRTYVKPAYRYLIFGILTSILTSISGGVSIMIVVPVIDRLFAYKPIVLPKGMASWKILVGLTGWLNAISPLLLLKYVLLFLILSVFVKGILSYLQNYLLKYFSSELVTGLRLKMYEKLQSLSMKFFSKKRTGELTTRMIYDIGLLYEIFSRELPLIFLKIPEALFWTFVIFKIDWQLSAIAILEFPLLIFPIINLGKKLRKLTRYIQVNYANLGNIIHESIYGQPVIKAYNQEGVVIGKFSGENQAILKNTMSVAKRMGAISPFTELLTTIGAALIIFMGVHKVFSGQLDPGFLFFFLAGLISLVNPVKTVINSFASIYQSSAALPRIYGLLEEEQDVRDEGRAEFTGLGDSIVFSGVRFAYEGENDVLKGIDFKINSGERIGIVGPVGAGKSSVIGLLLRFYDPQEGEIFFDGKPIRSFSLKSLRKHIGLVTQEPFIFSDSIRNNIIFGNREASEENFMNVVKLSRVSEFVEKMPEKYETVVGERGFTLSGGQKQLICLARAMLKNPSILILDEVSAALDANSEKLVHEALGNIMSDRTVIFIAHRLATVKNLDGIIVIRYGKIEETGSHDVLIAKDGFYARLWNLQYKQKM